MPHARHSLCASARATCSTAAVLSPAALSAAALSPAALSVAALSPAAGVAAGLSPVVYVCVCVCDACVCVRGIEIDQRLHSVRIAVDSAHTPAADVDGAFAAAVFAADIEGPAPAAAAAGVSAAFLGVVLARQSNRRRAASTHTGTCECTQGVCVEGAHTQAPNGCEALTGSKYMHTHRQRPHTSNVRAASSFETLGDRADAAALYLSCQASRSSSVFGTRPCVI